MTNTNTAAARPVSTSTDGEELTWAGSEHGTGVTLRDIGYGLTSVEREGKGDWLHVDLGLAARGRQPVTLGSGVTVAWIAQPYDFAVTVQTNAQYRAEVAGAPVEWTEYPNVETALVDLAFLHLA